VSDLTSQVYRETETPQPILTRNDSIEDVIEARTAFVYNTHAPRNPANTTYDDDDDDDEVDEEEGDDVDDLHDDRHFYSHGAQHAAGAPVPRSGSSRRIRVFKSSRRDASRGASSNAANAAAAQLDDNNADQQEQHDQQQVSVRSVFSTLWSFVWAGLSEPFVRGVVIGAGVCVVHYLLVIKRSR
jgi:hypothetical protein